MASWGLHPCVDCGQPCSYAATRCKNCYAQLRLVANPWRGQVVCPSCGSADWTLPYDGDPDSERWRCVWPCHVWLFVTRVDFGSEALVATRIPVGADSGG